MNWTLSWVAIPQLAQRAHRFPWDWAHPLLATGIGGQSTRRAHLVGVVPVVVNLCHSEGAMKRALSPPRWSDEKYLSSC